MQTLFSERMGLDLAGMKAQRCRLSDKAGKDPDLIRRAINIYASRARCLARLREQTGFAGKSVHFPHKLVDAMKELVRHDLSPA